MVPITTPTLLTLKEIMELKACNDSVLEKPKEELNSKPTLIEK